MIDQVLDVMLARGLDADKADAIAVIEAMREPVSGMVPAGWLAAHRVNTADRCNHVMLRRAWEAMIDAALGNTAHHHNIKTETG